jgi:hypothetical protein
MISIGQLRDDPEVEPDEREGGDMTSGQISGGRRTVWQAWGLGLWLVFLLLVGGCGEDPQQLLDTAKFEEQQRNLTHAAELYERIIREHADSPQAQEAMARMRELRKGGP